MMPSCKEVARYVSEEIDHPRPFWQRIMFRLHLAMCRMCGGHAAEIRQIHNAVQERSRQLKLESDVASDVVLSDAARERIQQALAEHS